MHKRVRAAQARRHREFETILFSKSKHRKKKHKTEIARQNSLESDSNSAAHFGPRNTVLKASAIHDDLPPIIDPHPDLSRD